MKFLGRFGGIGLIPFAVVIVLVAIQWQDPGRIYSRAQNLVFDLYQQIQPRPYEDTRATTGVGVRFIDIDEVSLKRYGQWPWPRTLIAKMLDQAHTMGAKLIIFDIAFSEPDRTSPEVLASTLPPATEFDTARQAMLGLPQNDDVLIAAMKAMPTVTAFIMTNDENDNAEPVLKKGMSALGAHDPRRFVTPPFSGAITSLPEIVAAAAGNGAFNVEPDSDGLIRRVNLLFAYHDKLYPSLSLEAIRLSGKPQSVLIRTTEGGGETAYGVPTGITALRAGSRTIDTTRDAAYWIHFTPPAPQRRISAVDLIEGTVDPERVKDSLLFVGTSALGLRDLRGTPLNALEPGVAIQAMAVEQMLLGHNVQRPDLMRGAEVFYSLILGLAVATLVLATSAYWALPVATGGIVVAAALSWLAFDTRLWLVDPAGSIATIIGAFTAAALISFIRTEGERRFVRSAFSHYLAPEVVNTLASSPDKLQLGGEARELTIMFCDIRGFTSIAEDYRDSPHELTKLINRILTPLTKVVLDHKGTIDKYIGDCIMAFWNAPLDDEDHARHSCLCSLELLEALKRLNAELELEQRAAGLPFRPIAVTTGLNSGRCIVGNMGSDLRFDYSVLGDAVNLAARIQAYSGNYGVAVALSEETKAKAGDDFAYLTVDYLAVKGRDEPVKVYALWGSAEVAASQAFQALEAKHGEIFAAFAAKDWRKVKQLTAECRTLNSSCGKLYDLYDSRADYFDKNPPADGWDGAWRATEK